MFNFSTHLKHLRQQKGITQKQLGIEIGTSERGIQNYELGARKPTYEILIALADYFDVPIDYLTSRGLYAKWDEINTYWDKFISSVKDVDVNIAKTISMLGDDRVHILQLLSVFVENVEITFNPPNTQIDITFKDIF